MAVPKRRFSKARTRRRHANWKLKRPNLTPCPRCAEPKRSHRVCPNCGYYRDREIVGEEA